MKDLVFYMYFELEDKFVGKGFVVKDVPFEDEDEFEEFNDTELLDYASELESEYGVHDWGTSPSDDIWSIGYSTYEVEAEKIDELMEKWRDTLQKHFDRETSPVVAFDERKGFTSLADELSDDDIYRLIKRPVAQSG